MTAIARITQQDADRAMKSVIRAGVERAQIIHDLKNQQIVIIIGESGSPAAAADDQAPGLNPLDKLLYGPAA